MFNLALQIVLYLTIPFGFDNADVQSPSSCGVESLQMALCLLGRDAETPRAGSALGGRGEHSLLQIRQAAEQLGLATYAVRLGNGSWVPNQIPAIIPLRLSHETHYVVLFEFGHDKAAVIDYPFQGHFVSRRRLLTTGKWDGTALFLANNERSFRGFEDERRSATLNSVVSTVFLCGIGTLLFVHLRNTRLNRSSARERSGGFTVIEVLVAIGVVSLLIALTLPAILAAREAASRTQCASNIRQIQLATNQYTVEHGSYPASTRPTNAMRGDLPKYFSITCAILPYCEEGATYNTINFHRPQNTSYGFTTTQQNLTALHTRIEILLCPSDSIPSSLSPGNSYRFNLGADPEGRTGPFAQGEYIHPKHIVDGLSHTIGISERRIGSWSNRYDSSRDLFFVSPNDSINPPWPSADEWLIDCGRFSTSYEYFTGAGSAWMLDGGAFTTYNHVSGPGHAVADCTRYMGGATTIGIVAAKSRHSTGVNAAYLDGSVRFFGSNVSLTMWRALGTRQGGELDESY